MDFAMEFILLTWTNFVSLTFIGFVAILIIAKLYIKIRSNFKILVNCWFCNQNTKVGYEQYNSWDCPHCGQYNGFTDDGDYNREILGQYESKGLSLKQGTGNNASSGHNGFCRTCNDNQSFKMEKLATFEPENERTFTEELVSFRDHLEETYRLCQRCENNLSKVLAEKKKMVLGLRLAQKVAEVPNEIKQFTKPAHIYISTRSQLLKSFSIATLFLFAIINWINIVGSIQINREKLNMTYGPIMSSIIFVVISHLTALTKVLTSYCKSALNFYFVEKCLLFVRTIFILLSYTVGIDFYRHVDDFGLVMQYCLPFGSMFLAFGLHLLDRFKVTKTTYLLGFWSVYTTLFRDVISQEYYVYKVLASLAILVLSLPSFGKKNDLDRILDSTANSFHRIHSEDYYLHEQSNTILNSSQSPHNTLNLSKSSADTSHCSNKSFSPVRLGQSSFKRMTSSTLNLHASPMSAFKSYSTEQLLPSKAGGTFSDHYTFKPMPKSLSINNLNRHNLNASLHSPRHDDTLNKTIDSTPNRSFVSCAASISSRQSLLSPSHFGGNNSHYCTAYASQQQPSWVSGGFFNHDKVGNHKNYFLNDITSNESISRGSSQSSGFESHTSSVQPTSDRLFSRENSIGRGDVDHLSVYSELQQPLDLHNCENSLHNKSFEERQRTQFNGLFIPTPSSFKRPKNNIFQSNAMDFESRDHWVRNSPIDLRRQAFQADYLANLTVDCSSNTNPFDFNGMNSFLPPVRKRYNLLGSISENRGIGQHFQTDTQ